MSPAETRVRTDGGEYTRFDELIGSRAAELEDRRARIESQVGSAVECLKVDAVGFLAPAGSPDKTTTLHLRHDR
jgi:hypothetical protein